MCLHKHMSCVFLPNLCVPAKLVYSCQLVCFSAPLCQAIQCLPSLLTSLSNTLCLPGCHNFLQTLLPHSIAK